MTSTLSLKEQYERLSEVKETDSFEIYFQRLKALIENCIELQQNDILNKLLQFHVTPLTAGSYNKEIFYILKDNEGYFHTNGKMLLAIYYRILGHIFYCRFELEKANKYYKYAISYSFEQKDYSNVASAMNNYILKDLHSMSESTGLIISKSIPLLLKASNECSIDDLISKLYFYFDLCVFHGKYHFIELLLKNIIEGDYVKGDSRFHLQLQLMQSLIYKFKGKLELAKDSLLYVFDTCIKLNQTNDLLIPVYKEIVELNGMQEGLFDSDLIDKLEEMKRMIKIESDLMQQYVETNGLYLPQDYPFTFGVKPDQFKCMAKTYLNKVNGCGHTLIIIECLQHEYNRDELIEMMCKLNDEMTLKFQNNLLVATVFDQSTLTLIVSLNEFEVKQLLSIVKEKMFEHYPLNTSNLQGIYYAYVNNVENNLTSYDECISIAYAYMYYKLKQ